MLDSNLWLTASNLQRFLEESNLRFCFIGGVALQRWGEPRFTRDVDATILVPFGAERDLAELVLKSYSSRIDDPFSFAVQARILLVSDQLGNNIDLSIGGLPYEERLVNRSSLWGTPMSGKIRTCSAEDLIVLKAFASRDQDWIDVERILVRQADRLDRSLVSEELSPLVDLKEDPTIKERLLQLFTKHPASPV